MKRSVLVAWLAGLVIFGTLVGYPLATVISDVVGVANRQLSIAARGMVAIVSVLILILARGRHVHSNTERVGLWTIGVFWALYSVKLLWSVLGADQEVLRLPWWEYLVFAFGTCLLPIAAVSRGQGPHTTRRWLSVTMWTMAGVSLVTMFTFFWESQPDSSLRLVGRLATEDLNAVSVGHVGGSVVLLGLAALTVKPTVGRLAGTLRALVVVVGVITLVYSGSRGAIAATMAATGLLVLGQVPARGLRLIGVVGIAGVLAFAVGTYVNPGIIDVIERRFSSIGTAPDVSIQARILAYGGAFRAFVANPILGGPLEVPETGYYPHNIVLEAFMNLGFVGGILMLAIAVIVIRQAWLHARAGTHAVPLALLAVQYLAGAFFSGSIYSSNQFWVMAGAVLAGQRHVPRQHTSMPNVVGSR